MLKRRNRIGKRSNLLEINNLVVIFNFLQILIYSRSLRLERVLNF